MSYVRFNVSRMFTDKEPWECSGSQFELGPSAARITWDNALYVARQHLDAVESGEPGWLIPTSEHRAATEQALDYIRGWAKETGAWDREEIESWSEAKCLALLVQNVASDMRHLDSDNCDLLECTYEEGSEVAECGYVTGWYWVERGELLGEVCS